MYNVLIQFISTDCRMKSMIHKEHL